MKNKTQERQQFVPEEDRLSRKPAFWVTCVLACHLLILFHFLQWCLHAALTHKTIDIKTFYIWSAEVWYVRAALSPLAIWLALRKRFEVEHWWRCVAIYLVGSIGIAILASVLQASTLLLLKRPKNLRGEAISMRKALDSGWFYGILFQAEQSTVYNIFTCWMLIGSVQCVFYYTEARKRELKASLLESELAGVKLDALRMQLRPHFLFNTLHSISALIQEEPVIAESMVLQLSHILRTSLRDDKTPIRPLREELELLEWHLGIERTRFGDRLTAIIDVDSEVLSCAVPHLLLLPLIENAIEHGVGKNVGKDIVMIRGQQKHGELHLEIANTNSQLEYGPDESLTMGIGLSNTIMRLQVLYGASASLELKEISPRGVSVQIRLPLITTDDSDLVLR